MSISPRVEKEPKRVLWNQSGADGRLPPHPVPLLHSATQYGFTTLLVERTLYDMHLVRVSLQRYCPP